jgi:nucleoside-diphosphate-sugar epimerase
MASVARVRALVMGGNRYIGLNLVFELARQGHDVTIMNSHEAPMPEGARRLHGDRQVPGTITTVLGPHRDDFDIVFDNTAYQVKDLEPMVELFAGRVQHFAFTSSVAVYRRTFVQPVLETFRTHHPRDSAPVKAYGVGKVQCEQYLHQLYQEHGFPYTVFRVSHTIGPRSPLPSREPIYFERLTRGRPILIPGEGFPFVNLVHVADVATLMVSIIGNPAAIGQIYNVSGAEYASVLGCVRMMAAAAGTEAEIIHVPVETARQLRAPLMHWHEGVNGGSVYSIDKALRELDWTPRFGLEAGYQDSYDWWASEGRDRYEYDFSLDDEVLAMLGR